MSQGKRKIHRDKFVLPQVPFDWSNRQEASINSLLPSGCLAGEWVAAQQFSPCISHPGNWYDIIDTFSIITFLMFLMKFQERS